jgi:hypothetical protein
VNSRVSWHDLPAQLRQLIEAEAGSFAREEQVGTGQNSPVGTVIHTARGRYVLKGVRSDHKRAVWTQANEALINPIVRDLTAPLLFHVEAAGWDVLGFGYLDGHRHADLSPGSPDLTKIAQTLRALAVLSPPADVVLRTMPDRFSKYAGERASLLAGTTITHTDMQAHNILIGPTAKVVDWAWPTLGAAWTDTACLALHMIRSGHHPKDAEEWGKNVPAFAAADDEAVSAFVAANAAIWTEISQADPQPWKAEVADASYRWAEHRGL